MTSSAQDIPSTAYKPQPVADGLDPATVVRPPQSGSASGAGVADQAAPDNSALNRLFPAVENRLTQAELPSGLKLGDYVIDARIGAGGMGAVFKAHDQRLDRTVALKILAPSQANDPSSVKRFQNEAKAAARLDHDNIARIYAVGEALGLHYIAFEYVGGITVRELIRERGVVAPHDTINFMLQISVALKHTAAAGVVHRDIKPSNLIYTPEGRTKLVDWGLARKEQLDENSLDLTVSGTTLGTFDYISPEQARDARNVDVRSDIYSLGCTSYHMLTGSPPYAEGTVIQKLLDHQGKTPPDPRERNPNVPRELSRIVAKMMASDPEDRYWSPQALTHDLLALAAQTGMRPIHPDGLTWRSEQDFVAGRAQRGMFWWWLGAFVLACAAAIVGDRWMVSRSDSGDSNSSFTAASVPPNGSVPPWPEIWSATNSTQAISPDVPTADGSIDQSPETRLFPNLEPSSWPAGIPGPIAKDLFSGNQPFQSVVGPVNEPLKVSENDAGQPVTPSETLPSDEIVDSASMPVQESTTGSPNRPVNTETAGSAGSFFRVLAANGDLLQTSPDLESALMVTPDSGVIEFESADSEPAVIDVTQLQVIDKSITIRSTTESVKPILRFKSSAFGQQIRGNEFIRIQGGSLTVSNVHLQVMIPESISTAWSLFSIEGNGRLRCRQSTVTIDSSFQTNATVVSLSRSSIPAVDPMNMDPTGSDVVRRVQFDDCVLRGAADLLAMEASDASSLEIGRCLLALDGAVIRYSGDNEIRNGIEEFSVRLSRVAGFINDGFLRMDLGPSGPRQPMQMRLRTEDSVLVGPNKKSLIEMSAVMEKRTLQDLLFWTGDHNLYGGWKNYLSIRGASSVTDGELTLDFPAWIRGNGQIQSSMPRQLPETDPIGPTLTRLDAWTVTTFLSLLENDAVAFSGPTDIADYGPDYSSLPAPPPLFAPAAAAQ